MDFSKIKINPDLPIAAYEEEIISKFEKSSNMIIIGETGSGKTTQIPLMLLKSLSKVQDLKEGKIAVTEPRRLAATSVSNYLATQMLGEELGKTIGYRIRFSEEISDDSVLIFMTDGIMLRETQIDPLLMNYSVVMVDEAHERNINSDFLIGLLVDIQKKRKEQGVTPLKIIVTSATLEKDKFENFFTKIEGEPLSIVEVPGRLFPITTTFSRDEVIDYEQTAANKVYEIVQSGKNGDILIFMPGKREIETTKKYIEELPSFDGLNLEIITVHANLPIEKQNEIFKKTDKRKVVIATNIAETSLTVPGVIFVIDSGLIKQMEFDPHLGMNSLITKFHARKGLEQRKGRAGRVEPGFYYPLFTEGSFNKRSEFQMPEILRTSLSQIVLIMKRIGVKDIEDFHFIDHPDTNLVRSAIFELQRYGALNQEEEITEKGIMMAALPLEPRLANLILEANKNGSMESICTIAAFLELKPVVLNLTAEDFYKSLVNIFESITNPNPEIDQIEKELDLIESNKILNYELKKALEYRIKNHELQIEDLPDAAEKEFNKYLNKVKILEHEWSDFFTLLNIFHKWQKNNMDPQWAEDNFLSIETLIEATNIREELLELVQKSGYEPNDKVTPDLERRIEKTLISSFRHNILAKQNFGSYRKIKSRDGGIRLHNSSVLLESKPDFVLAYEIIEINEIDSGPKLSARMIHTLPEDITRQLYPDIFKKEQRKKFQGKKKFKFRNDRGFKRRRRR